MHYRLKINLLMGLHGHPDPGHGKARQGRIKIPQYWVGTMVLWGVLEECKRMSPPNTPIMAINEHLKKVFLRWQCWWKKHSFLISHP
ncbi:hypothetical protein D3H65_04630 [Paraflavitalea soli]|uniref:Uncharacterized protein n=1 Tax=Paraflavitalea soli TaxID=2315862 RepID=A0A3B7MIA6_9BACT|nr:hypothetical protein D3H65_04630 [Paraflavitalea soli]